MRTSLLIRLYNALRPYPKMVWGTAAIALLLCGWSTSRLMVQENVGVLLPTHPKALHQAFAVMQKAPFVEALTITVGGNGTDPALQADALAAALRGPLFPVVITGASPTSAMAMLGSLPKAIPSLLSQRMLPALAQQLTPQGIRTALEADKNTLLSPKGLGMREIISQDPLGIRALALSPLAGLAHPSGMQWQGGHMLDATGAYAMVIAKPALSMTNAADASTIIQAFRNATKAVSPSTRVLLASGHRHAEANAQIIHSDLSRVLPVTLGLLLAAFVFFLRSWQGLAIFWVPVGALAVASAATAVVYGTVSGIVLGFGSVLLGITSDYAVHMYFAMRASATAQQAIHNVAPPMIMAGVTTMAAFAVMHASSIPAMQQLSTLAIAGIVAALFFSLVLLPLCLRPGAPHGHSITKPLVQLRLSPAKIGGVWVCIFVLLAWSVPRLHLDGDIRSLAYTDKVIQEDEAAIRAIWHTSREGTVIAATSQPQQNSPEALEQALQMNDAVWDVLQTNAEAQSLQGNVLSVGPLWPSQKTQQQRHTAWQAFWAIHKNSTVQLLSQEGATLGFAPQAFSAFTESLGQPPLPFSPAQGESFGFDLFTHLLLRQTPQDTTVFTLIPGQQPLAPALVQALEETGAQVASGESFRSMVKEATRHDLALLSGLALLAVVASIVITLRNVAQSALVLLPTAGSLAAVLATFALLQLPLTLFHAVSLPLIMALSVDYGVFMLANMQGQLDNASRKGVALSAITTIIGFGCLAFATHPALFSLGITVGSGISFSVVIAMFILPRMVCTPAKRSA